MLGHSTYFIVLHDISIVELCNEALKSKKKSLMLLHEKGDQNHNKHWFTFEDTYLSFSRL